PARPGRYLGEPQRHHIELRRTPGTGRFYTPPPGIGRHTGTPARWPHAMKTNNFTRLPGKLPASSRVYSQIHAPARLEGLAGRLNGRRGRATHPETPGETRAPRRSWVANRRPWPSCAWA